MLIQGSVRISFAADGSYQRFNTPGQGNGTAYTVNSDTNLTMQASDSPFSFYSIFLLDQETWIGKYTYSPPDSDTKDSETVLLCDYILKVESKN